MSFLYVNFPEYLKILPIIVVSGANLENNFFQIKNLNFSDYFIILHANHTLVGDLIVGDLIGDLIFFEGAHFNNNKTS